MPEIGKRISFTPSAFMSDKHSNAVFGGCPSKVKATIVYINEAHKWFRAEFTIWGKPMYECFKF